MNDISPREKISIIWFFSITVKGNWAHLAERNSWPEAKIAIVFRLQ